MAPSSENARSFRTCVACGTKVGRSSLIRISVSHDGCLVPDLKRNLGGRGAHVCANRNCIEQALSRRLFDKALKTGIKNQNRDLLFKNLIDSLRRQLETLVRSSALARHVVPGFELSSQAIREGRAHAILVAMDSAKRQEITERAREAGVPLIKCRSKTELGGLLNRKDTGVAAINDMNLAKALVNVSLRLEALIP